MHYCRLFENFSLEERMGGMKKILAGLLILIAVIFLSNGANITGAPVLAYVYSDSMEPLIHVNDAFLVLPAQKLDVGDIIMYRPVVLQAPYITHRIVGFGDDGYITKGDNSAYKDQESAEPQVRPERVVGRVVTVNGRPVLIPGLGRLSSIARSLLGKHAKNLALIFLISGLAISLSGRHQKRIPKPRRRIRLGQIYRLVVILGAGIVLSSIIIGSRVTPVKYLVSEYPGNLGNQVPLNETGLLNLEAHNNGLFPVRMIVTGIPPLTIHQAPEYLMSLSSQTVLVEVTAQHETGVQQGYVQLYSYPLLLPGAWIEWLHRIRPALAMITITAAMYLWLTLLFRLIGRIHGLEEWLPLKALRDKLLQRRMSRAAAKFSGRRRVR